MAQWGMPSLQIEISRITCSSRYRRKPPIEVTIWPALMVNRAKHCTSWRHLLCHQVQGSSNDCGIWRPLHSNWPSQSRIGQSGLLRRGTALTSIGRRGSRVSDPHESGIGDFHCKYASKRDWNHVWQMVDRRSSADYTHRHKDWVPVVG